MAELNEQQFIELVKQSEAEAEQDINRYKIKLALFAALGYGVIFAVLITLVLLVGGTVVTALVSSSLFLLLVKKKFIFLILIAIWTFLRALWVKFDPPSGYLLERDKYPELFQEIDHLTHTLDALTIHQVILDDRLNAAVVQHPRFGLFGGQQNTLFLGLQLLLALSPQEMKSVLAHEFGHLSGNHSRFSGWIYRVRITWFRVMEAFDQSNSFGAGLMRRFFDWYAPKFSAYSFALARNNEYEADRVAAELTSPATAAKALINVYTKAPYIEQEYWDHYFQQADTAPTPPTAPYAGLATFLKQSPISREQVLALIRQEMQVETHYADTHPALKDRVTSLIDQAVVPDTFTTNAAEAWLGSRYEKLLQHFDQQWMKNNNEKWKNRYEYVQHSKQLLAESKDLDPQTLTDDKLWELAHAAFEFENDETALPLFLAFHQRHPHSVGAGYYVGLILARKQDESALDYLRIAFESPNTIGDAARWGYDLLMNLKKEREAEQWWQQARTAADKHQAIAEAQSHIADSDHFTAPRIDADLQGQLLQTLAEHKNVGSTWLAQKTLPYNDADPVYILAFRPKGLYLSFEAIIKSVEEALNIDANVFVVCLWGDDKSIAKKVKKAGTKIQ